MLKKSNLIKVLDTFLESPNDYVLLLKGKWGVGKTYFWNNYLVDQKLFSIRKYKYVSLFGIASIAAIRTQLAFNSTISNLLTSDLFESGQSLSIPSTGVKVSFIKQLSIFFGMKSVNHCVICFDDLERKSDKLSIEEFIGLVSDLKNKQCKVILITNENKIITSEQETLKLMKERILDSQVELLTTPDEVAEVMLEGDFYSKAAELCRLLKINNFRIASKIRATVDVLSNRVPNLTIQLRDFLQTQTTFLVWSYLKGENSIPIELIKNYSTDSAATFFRKELNWHEKLEGVKENISGNEYEYGQLLWDNDFFFEDLSKCILDYLDFGILDEEYFDKCINQINTSLLHEKAEKELREVWDLYSNNYTVTQKTFCDAMTTFVSQNYEHLSINSFMQAKDFLKKLDSPLIEELVKSKYSHFISSVDKTLLHTDFQFQRQELPNDSIFSEMVKEELKKETSALDIIQAMKILLENRGDKVAIEYFNSITVDEIYEWLTSLNFKGSITLVRAFIKNMRIADDTKLYVTKIEDALKRMSKREQIDHYRVKLLYGITLGDEKAK